MELTLYVFDSSISPLGVVDIVTGLNWEEKFDDIGTVELWCPLNNSTVELLKEGNLLWKGGESAGVIESRESTIASDGTPTIHIQGRLIESYLDYRTIYPVVTKIGYASDVICSLVDENLINPSNTDRVIPLIEIDPEQEPIGSVIAYQALGSTVLTETTDLCQANALGFRLRFFPKSQQLLFRVYSGANRTIDQNKNDPVLFSSDMDDILESSYSYNNSDLRNVAYVQSESDSAIVGDAVGLSRREVFVDASSLKNTTESGESISSSDYNAMLVEYGKATLETYKEIELFDATIRTFNVTGYVYGTDFFLGDTVTVYDSRLKVRTNAIVTAVLWTYDENGEQLNVSFGYSQPTIANKLRRLV